MVTSLVRRGPAASRANSMSGSPRVNRRVIGGVGAASRLLAETPRATLELAATSMLAPLLAADRRGDGHPVLVLPGFLQHDLSTVVLRAYLRWLNYSVSGWQLGANMGSTESVVSGLEHASAHLPKAPVKRSPSSGGVWEGCTPMSWLVGHLEACAKS